MIKIVFMGTPEFAVPSLQALLDSPNTEVTGVITQPDRPAGRGRRLQAPPVKVVAEGAGVDVFQTPSLKKDPSALEWMAGRRPDLAVVAAFGQILTRDFFSLPPFGTLNVHASLLPKYRGASPAAYAILDGEKETGVSLMLIDEGLDTGGVLSRRTIPIGEDETRGQLEKRLARVGAELLLETVARYVGGHLTPQPQENAKASLAPMIRKADALLAFDQPAHRIHNRVRAFNPWPGARARWKDTPVIVWESRLPRNQEPSAEARAGEVVAVRPGLRVMGGDGRSLDLLILQPANRRRISGLEFANGFGLRPGDFFS